MRAHDERTGDIFREVLWAQMLPHIRFAFLAAAIMFIGFWPWDFYADPEGAWRTLPIRLAATGFFAGIWALLKFNDAVSRRPLPAYVGGMVSASVFLMAIGLSYSAPYVTYFHSNILVIMAIGMIGPYDRIAIPLTLAVAAVPALGLPVLHLAGAGLPGLPGLDHMVEIMALQIGAVALTLGLTFVDTRREHSLYSTHLDLQHDVSTDPLTEIANRRGLEAAFDREVARTRRSGRPLAVLILDIDHFKQVNDTRGHAVGDEVLMGLASRLEGLLREIDLLARTGGEEFVMLLPETGGDEAMATAERLRAAVAERPFPVSDGEVAITVSIGAAAAAPDMADLDRLLKAADRALYAAKEGGRNRCAFGSFEVQEAAAAAQ